MRTAFDRTTRRAVRKAEHWLVWLGRFGYVAKGVVYTLIGVLAVLTAIGAGGQTTDSTGALHRIGEAPFGRYLLLAIGVGLVGYAVWRFVQAFLDTENKGSDAKAIAVRASYFVIGVAHVAIAIPAFAFVFGNSDNGGNSTEDWTATLMSQPFGQWLVGIVGALIFARGGFHIYRAYSRKFREKLKLREMSATEDKWATRLGRLGYGARGLVFTIIGVFLILAAMHANPEEARGLDGALDAVAQQQWGSALLGIVALGLVAYGLYMFVEARYRRMVIT
jgi:Na+/proline symporter